MDRLSQNFRSCINASKFGSGTQQVPDWTTQGAKINATSVQTGNLEEKIRPWPINTALAFSLLSSRTMRSKPRRVLMRPLRLLDRLDVEGRTALQFSVECAMSEDQKMLHGRRKWCFFSDRKLVLTIHANMTSCSPVFTLLTGLSEMSGTPPSFSPEDEDSHEGGHDFSKSICAKLYNESGNSKQYSSPC